MVGMDDKGESDVKSNRVSANLLIIIPCDIYPYVIKGFFSRQIRARL